MVCITSSVYFTSVHVQCISAYNLMLLVLCISVAVLIYVLCGDSTNTISVCVFTCVVMCVYMKENPASVLSCLLLTSGTPFGHGRVTYGYVFVCLHHIHGSSHHRQSTQSMHMW